VNEEASDKVLEVEQKYNEIRRPVYNKRNDIIHNIPDFWLTAFLSHPVLSDLLTDEDQKAGFCLVPSDLTAVQKMPM
jgi:template-activating factor I